MSLKIQNIIKSIDNQDFKKALSKTNKILKKNPNNPFPCLCKIYLHYRLNQIDQQVFEIKLAEFALQVKDIDVHTLTFLVSIFNELFIYYQQFVIKILNIIISRFPNLAVAYNELFVTCYRLGDIERMISAVDSMYEKLKLHVLRPWKVITPYIYSLNNNKYQLNHNDKYLKEAVSRSITLFNYLEDSYNKNVLSEFKKAEIAFMVEFYHFTEQYEKAIFLIDILFKYEKNQIYKVELVQIYCDCQLNMGKPDLGFQQTLLMIYKIPKEYRLFKILIQVFEEIVKADMNLLKLYLRKVITLFQILKKKYTDSKEYFNIYLCHIHFLFRVLKGEYFDDEVLSKLACENLIKELLNDYFNLMAPNSYSQLRDLLVFSEYCEPVILQIMEKETITQEMRNNLLLFKYKCGTICPFKFIKSVNLDHPQIEDKLFFVLDSLRTLTVSDFNETNLFDFYHQKEQNYIVTLALVDRFLPFYTDNNEKHLLLYLKSVALAMLGCVKESWELFTFMGIKSFMMYTMGYPLLLNNSHNIYINQLNIFDKVATFHKFLLLDEGVNIKKLITQNNVFLFVKDSFKLFYDLKNCITQNMVIIDQLLAYFVNDKILEFIVTKESLSSQVIERIVDNSDHSSFDMYRILEISSKEKQENLAIETSMFKFKYSLVIFVHSVVLLKQNATDLTEKGINNIKECYRILNDVFGILFHNQLLYTDSYESGYAQQILLLKETGVSDALLSLVTNVHQRATSGLRPELNSLGDNLKQNFYNMRNRINEKIIQNSLSLRIFNDLLNIYVFAVKFILNTTGQLRKTVYLDDNDEIANFEIDLKVTFKEIVSYFMEKTQILRSTDNDSIKENLACEKIVSVDEFEGAFLSIKSFILENIQKLLEVYQTMID